MITEFPAPTVLFQTFHHISRSDRAFSQDRIFFRAWIKRIVEDKCMLDVSNQPFLKAAGLIRLGVRTAGLDAIESKRGWISKLDRDDKFMVSASGFLLIGKIGNIERAYADLLTSVCGERNYRAYLRAISLLSGLDERIIRAIADLDFRRRLSIADIVAELESRA
jgi:hypothetical protein